MEIINELTEIDKAYLFISERDQRSSVARSLFHPFQIRGLNQLNNIFEGKLANLSGVRSSACSEAQQN